MQRSAHSLCVHVMHNVLRSPRRWNTLQNPMSTCRYDLYFTNQQNHKKEIIKCKTYIISEVTIYSLVLFSADKTKCNSKQKGKCYHLRRSSLRRTNFIPFTRVADGTRRAAVKCKNNHEASASKGVSSFPSEISMVH